MKRILTVALLTALAGCQSPEQVQRQPLPQLPEDATPRKFGELLDRVRYQVTFATEVSYKNKWAQVEETARGLEQSARLLARAEEVPADHKETLAALCGDLGKEAVKLREAARAKDDKQVDASLARLNSQVRQLHPKE